MSKGVYIKHIYVPNVDENYQLDRACISEEQKQILSSQDVTNMLCIKPMKSWKHKISTLEMNNYTANEKGKDKLQITDAPLSRYVFGFICTGMLDYI